MNTYEFLAIIIGSGIGTAVVQVILSKWVQEQIYLFKAKNADKRECANLILKLINTGNYIKYFDVSNEIYNKADLVSDRLETIGKKEYGKKLDEYVSRRRELSVLTKSLPSAYGTSRENEVVRHFLALHNEIDRIRKELVVVASELKI